MYGVQDGSKRVAAISRSIEAVRAGFLDGLYFDYELPLGRNQSELSAAFTAYVAQATRMLHAAIPGSKLVVATAWSPDDIDGRNYDYVGLARSSDFLFVMNYDTRSAIYGRCIASANAPLSKASRSIQRYLDIGVPARQLIFGLPWYGYSYPCLPGTADDAEYCPIAEVPFRGVNCTDAAGHERPYAVIMAQLSQGNRTTDVRWDTSTQSPYFNYKGLNGSIHQQWFDNPRSLSLKYQLAYDQGLKGIGFYATPDLDPWGNATTPGNKDGPAQTAAMWDAVKQTFSKANGIVSRITMRYNGTRTRLLNPERGYRHELDDLCGQCAGPEADCIHATGGQLLRLHECAKFNMTLAQTYCYLDGEQDTISSQMLQRLERGFAKLRAANVKALLRFAYDRCSGGVAEGNYTTARILKHIQQLSPIVTRNIDVVYALQTGFVGCWGEFHSSKARIEYNSTAVAQIVSAELNEMLPVDRKITMRYPWDKCCGRDGQGGALRSTASKTLGLNWGVVDSQSAHSGNAFARLGYDDDGFLCCGVNATDGGTWQTSLYRSRMGPASARSVATDTTFRAQDGYLVGIGFEYERAESAFLPMDAEMYWNEGAFTIATKNASVDGHAAAHRMYLQHLTSLSLVHGFSALDGRSPGGGASPTPPHRPPNKLSRESIDVWQRTPLNLDFIDAWGLPIDSAHVETIAGIKNATCAESIVSIEPSRRVLCDRPKARPLGEGNSTAQEKRCLSAGCCWDPVQTPGPHPWCFLPGQDVPVRRKLQDVNYTIGRYIEDHLGYRLSVQTATFPRALKRGTHSFTIDASVVNFGFSIPQNRRPLHVVLMTVDNVIVRSVTVSGIDVRTWQPHEPADPFAVPLQHNFSALLPTSELETGEYDIGVYLPDERVPLNKMAAAAIRFANDVADLPWRTWGPGGSQGGVNVLGKIVVT